MTVDNNLVRFASELFDLTEELEAKHPKFRSTYAPYTLQYLDSEGNVLFQFWEEGVEFYPAEKTNE